jgi:hypothetical protein
MTPTPLSDIVSGKVTLTDALKRLFATSDPPPQSEEYLPQVDGVAKAAPYTGDLTTEQLAALRELPALYRDAAEVALRQYITYYADGNPDIVRAEQAPGTVVQFWVQQQETATT